MTEPGAEAVRLAQRDFYDEAAIRCAIQDADARHEMGALTDTEYKAIVDGLLGRLVIARRHPDSNG